MEIERERERDRGREKEREGQEREREQERERKTCEVWEKRLKNDISGWSTPSMHSFNTAVLNRTALWGRASQLSYTALHYGGEHHSCPKPHCIMGESITAVLNRTALWGRGQCEHSHPVYL